jgi:DNA helicase-2/ATP-dependent DNA helicase PcrA
VDQGQIAVVSFTNASVIDLRVRLFAYCEKHHQDGIKDVSITTLHSLALRLLRQAGLLENYPTRPLVLDDWELENIYDAEFGVDRGITSKKRREKIRRFYEALWSTNVPNATTYVAPDPPITDAERQHFDIFHQPTARVYSAVLPGEIVRMCVQATATGAIDPVQLLGLHHVVVDEYQDLNPADLEFVDVLGAAGVTIFVAGDDDQSVYSFRHASPLGIQTFTERYPGAAAHALNGESARRYGRVADREILHRRHAHQKR